WRSSAPCHHAIKVRGKRPLWVGFCHSENAEAAVQQFFYARVRFVRHTRLLNTVEAMAALAEQRPSEATSTTVASWAVYRRSRLPERGSNHKTCARGWRQ
ncbi:MAG TPA: hypothetical protein VFY00_05635, partial [Arenimonas sp.]|nr:hypothetical protein [Arenimonas sp.]